MKALLIHGAEDMRIEDVAVPEPGEGEVLLRVHYVGICGSDLHYYFHGENGENLVREPFAPGHEVSATVETDPSGEWASGTPVTVHPARYGPEPAVTGRPHLGPDGDYLGSAANLPHRQGAAAEYVLINKDMLRRLPDGLSLQDAALAEPLGVALHALTIAGEDLGNSALVLGAGPVGLLVVAALVARGLDHVAVADIQESALARARALGAHETYLIGTDDPPAVAYPVVFECSAAPAAVSQAIASTDRAGVVVQVGTLSDAAVGVNLAPLVSKEVQLRGSFRFSTEIDEAVDVLAANPAIGEVVTHVLPAAESVRAFEIAKDSANSGKVLIEF